jgi:stage III sporulation protein AF
METIITFAKNYVCFMLVLFLFSYLAPREDYRRYFQFFISVLMAAALLSPLLSLFTGEENLKSGLSRLTEEIGDIEYQEKGEAIVEKLLREAAETKED